MEALRKSRWIVLLRQGYHKDNRLLLRNTGLNLSTMGTGDGFGQGQAYAMATHEGIPGRISPVEPAKEPGQNFPGYGIFRGVIYPQLLDCSSP